MRGVFVLVSAVFVFAGCDQPMKVSAIDHMDIQTPPVCRSFDADTTPDGLQARVFFYGRSLDKKVVTVSPEGTLTIMLFDGNRKHADLNALQPLKVWEFDDMRLENHRSRWMGLWCYLFNLHWGDARPREGMVTVRINFTEKTGRTIFSEPQTILSGL